MAGILGSRNGSGSAPVELPAAPQLAALHRRIEACRDCAEAGFLDHAVPILPQPTPSPVVLVGQAPGRLEEGRRLPFSGRAGRQLFRWLEQAGAGPEAEARQLVYLTSITKCFPGPALSGSGDRRPSGAEVELCRRHLDAQLELLRPRLLLPVGQLAIARFLGFRPMEELVGRVFDGEGRELPEAGSAELTSVPPPLVLPLPHPSGASRWLNPEPHRRLLAEALLRLSHLLLLPDLRSP